LLILSTSINIAVVRLKFKGSNPVSKHKEFLEANIGRSKIIRAAHNWTFYRSLSNELHLLQTTEAYSYEAEFIQKLLDEKNKPLAVTFKVSDP
jgi:hypothetical protein